MTRKKKAPHSPRHYSAERMNEYPVGSVFKLTREVEYATGTKTKVLAAVRIEDDHEESGKAWEFTNIGYMPDRLVDDEFLALYTKVEPVREVQM